MPNASQRLPGPTRFALAYRRVALPLLWGLTLLLAGPAHATQIAGLFETEIPVTSQTEAQRKDALRQAFRQLLTKVTGDPKVAKRDDLKEEIALAENYAQKYRYAKGAGGESILSVTFDEGAVSKLLESRGIALWGANRPAVIAWIGLNRGAEQRLLSPELDPALREGIEQGARQAGVPLILPLGDLEDQSRLSAAKLAAPNSEEAIRAASERYAPDRIFVGLLNEKPGEGWAGNWSLLTDEGTKRWQSQGPNPNALATEAFQKVAESLAQQFTPGATPTPTEGGVSPVELAVSGVNGFADYARIKRLLYAMNSAHKVRLRGAESDQLVYEMESRGSLDMLQRELILGGVLKPGEEEVSGGPDDAGMTRLHYEVAL